MKTTVAEALLALLAAWLVFRGLRRLAGVALIAALLAGAVAIADRHGVALDDARRVARCETRAINHAAGALWSAASSSSSPTAARPLDGVRAIGRCDLQPAPQTPRRTSR
jgi:hypothetical protein